MLSLPKRLAHSEVLCQQHKLNCIFLAGKTSQKLSNFLPDTKQHELLACMLCCTSIPTQPFSQHLEIFRVFIVFILFYSGISLIWTFFQSRTQVSLLYLWRNSSWSLNDYHVPGIHFLIFTTIRSVAIPQKLNSCKTALICRWTEFQVKNTGKISAQPHTIVKQICFPNGNVLF